jgi:hypothetical protein
MGQRGKTQGGEGKRKPQIQSWGSFLPLFPTHPPQLAHAPLLEHPQD